ncbi:putative 22.8 kDa protein in gp15-gp3 intergenic region [Frankliniella fusca]|uniref:22.8 kDa protein in gp15-gp3 intergenic region n=1 Tax=Frankliniella fusca TaxID=407009 RepID=A0AAE1GSJ5_9NEOP|nr:putative 22.8 kDa protein in gp15-gp3 intergenic region [Frankliniella fusca]
MEELINGWELGELLPRLHALGITDVEALSLLGPEHSEQLFERHELGLQLKFFKRLKEHNSAAQRKEHVVLAVGAEGGEIIEVEADVSFLNASSSSSSSSSKRSQSPDAFEYNPAPKKTKGTSKVGTRAIQNLDIRSLLAEEDDGPPLLEYFSVHKTFTRRHRDILTSIVVKAARKINDCLKNEDFNLLSVKIQECFPGELSEIYYIGPFAEGRSQTISKGKLPVKYRNVLKREKEIAGGSSSGKSRSTLQTIKSPYDNVNGVEITKDIRDAHLWLENNSIFVDWPLLKAKWRLSAPLRLRNLYGDKSDDPIAAYIAKWPCLKHPSGYSLLEVDFDILYTEKEVSLLSRWDVFVAKILVLASQVSDQVAKECLVLAKNTTHAGSKGVLALNILPALCPPTTRIKSKGAKATEQRRLLVSNSRAGLLLHVTDTANLARLLRERRDMLYSEAKKSQPFLVFVGPNLSNIKEYYVDVSGILYRLNSVMKAVDVCFKATTALHADYPPESITPWMLIQRLLYEISTDWDSEVPYDIIASYNAITHLNG